MNEKKKSRNTLLRLSAFIPLVAIVAYMVWCASTKREFGIPYAALMATALVLFWVMTDIVVPVATGEFSDRTPEQMASYKKYAALELVGYAGLAYFAGAMNNNTGLYGAIAFALCTMYKRRFRDEYMGITHDEEEVSEETADGAAQVDAAAEDTAVPADHAVPEDAAVIADNTAADVDSAEESAAKAEEESNGSV